MLFSYKKTLLSLIYQFSIGIFFLYLILCSQSPACAGKTSSNPVGTPSKSEHPRVCGKNSNSLFKFKWKLGSLPRVREKHFRQLQKVFQGRSTPASAGKTSHLLNFGISVIGSPPRVREKLEFLRCQLALLKDHPRVCGKNSVFTRAAY